MAFADHFSAVAAKYAAYRPSYPQALADMLAERTHPDVAWDIGCGSGQLSVALAERFARVIATDPSQAQLDAAVAHPRVEYRCSPAEASDLPDASVDLAVAAQAAHWFDWPRFVAEVGRVAKPGALVALVSYGITELEGDAGRELRRYYLDDAGPHWPKERRHVENGYRDLVLPWPAVEAPAIAMTAQWTREELVGYVSTWSATAKLVKISSAPYEAFAQRLAAIWPDNEPRLVRWPLTIKLARL
jgi:SAM-dependent methyltransferase